jgi:PAS domain-containing protein
MKAVMICLVFGLLLSSPSEANEAFNQVYKIVHGKDNGVYLITDQGTWQVKKDKLYAVEAQHTQVLTLADYDHLFARDELKPSIWQNLAGLGYVVLLLMFGILYLYYQSSLNRRRKAFYERIKLQQQVLSIAFLATGDEVLECNIGEREVTRINQNAKLNLGDDIYFQSEKFISQLHPDDSSFFIGHFESLLSGGKNNYEITYRISDEQGEWIWLVERGCVIERDPAGIATRLVASMRDISEIKHDQELLVRMVDELEVRLKRAEAAATLRD